MSVLDLFENEVIEEIDQRKIWDKEYTPLTWKIIEWKVAYYRPDLVHRSRVNDYTISDDEYDKSEIRYLELTRLLGFRNYLVHKGYPGFEDLGIEYAMFEIDESRPSIQLVINKLCSKKPKINK